MLNFDKYIGGGVGTSVSGVGAIWNQIQANKMERKAESDKPTLEDENQVDYLNQSMAKGSKQEQQIAADRTQMYNDLQGHLEDIRRRRNSFQTGAAYSEPIRQLRQETAGLQRNIANYGSTGGATLSALSRSQNASNQGVNQILAQGQQQENYYTGLEQQGVSNMYSQLQGNRQQEIGTSQYYTGLGAKLTEDIANRKFAIQNRQYEMDLLKEAAYRQAVQKNMQSLTYFASGQNGQGGGDYGSGFGNSSQQM